MSGFFGVQEKIHFIEDISYLGPKGEDVYLGHKTSGVFFFAGIFLKDDGYVLGVSGLEDSYYELDTSLIQELQVENVLPSPMPQYSISLFEYAIGYSLWLVLLAVFLFQKIQGKLKA